MKRDRSWREKYKDVKTNGVCERKMRKKSVPCYLASQQVRRCVGESRTGSDISCEEIY